MTRKDKLILAIFLRMVIITLDGARKQSVTLPHDDLPQAFAWGFFLGREVDTKI